MTLKCIGCGDDIVMRGPTDRFQTHSHMTINDDGTVDEETIAKCSKCLLIEEAEEVTRDA